MPHDISLMFGLAAAKLSMPPLAGYLLAGVAIGPYTPGFVGDTGLAGQLAEVGVMLLMFGVGLHFSMADLLAVRRIAIPGAIAQIAVAVALGAGTALAWGWTPGEALVFGLCLSVASTVVLLRALEASGQLESMNGCIAVGWLVVEDLVMVLVLVLLPALAGVFGAGAKGGPEGLWGALALTLAKVAAFVAFMLLVGRRVLPRILWWIARTGSRELFTLCVVASAIGVAFGAAKLFDVSFALGAFFAGMMLRESEYSHRAAEESLPLRDAFAVLFFVSVGMLFDPSVLWTQPLHLAIAVAIVMLGKTLAAIAIVLVFRYPLSSALTIGASLAQIGEFSFILAGLGLAHGLLPAEGQQLVLAAALVSIAANAAMFAAIAPLQRWLRARSSFARALDARADPLGTLPDATDPALLTGQVVIVGYGRVGRRIGALLRERGVPFVVAEQNREIVEALRAEGLQAVSGDGSTAEALVQAHVTRASVLAIAIPDTVHVRRMVEIARTLNPAIRVVVRTHGDDEAELMRAEGLGDVLMGEEELARAMAARVVERLASA